MRRGAHIELYWSFAIFGVAFAFISFLFGEIIGDWLGGVFHFDHFGFVSPVIVVGGATAFGAFGIFLNRLFDVEGPTLLLLSILFAVAVSSISYFAYVKPMRKAESSLGISIAEMEGKIVKVTIPIPADGLGEVIYKSQTGIINFTAISFDNVDIPLGSEAIVVRVVGKHLKVMAFKI
ncbi:NfeD family protein [Cohnella suwonensis]|uniref:NfeD family protein n=1 Tax=Cohnella suwonensis TaxID=696072 RepID=A0ABW0LWG6_9BACL